MSNIQKTFQDKNIVIPFLTCGDPDLETTALAVQEAVKGGAEMIGLRIPFSDPTAEGAKIQQSNLRALAGGVTTEQIFAFVRKLRQEVRVPFLFETYANVVFSYGIEAFIQNCKEADIDGLILKDLPYEEQEEFMEECQKYGMNLISYLATTSGQRMKKIAERAEGFLYLVSGPGESQEEKRLELQKIIKAVRQRTEIPCVIEMEEAYLEGDLKNSVDGVIIGTPLVLFCEQYGKDAPKYIREYVAKIKKAIQ